MSENIELRAIILKEDDGFVVQCLEHDICTQADTLEELQKRFSCLVQAYLAENGGTLQGLDPAPEGFHKMWDDASEVETNESGIRMAMAA